MRFTLCSRRLWRTEGRVRPTRAPGASITAVILFPTIDHDRASGGIRVIYAMVDALNNSGLDAAVWHGSDAFRATWFEHHTRVVHGLERHLAIGDIVVWPELGGSRYQNRTTGSRVVMLNQSHPYTLQGSSWRNLDSAPYPGWPNVVAVVATSRAIERYIRALVQDRLPVHRVPVFIDPTMFRDEPKQRVITAFAFRRPEDLVSIKYLVERDPKLPIGWRFEVMEHLHPSEVANRLGRAAIFVSLAKNDGFSLPGAEAMAAGCHVVGFHGDGAREYMRPEFSTSVDDPDVVTLARTVVEAACQFEESREIFDLRRVDARDFIAEHYSKPGFEAATCDTFLSLIRGGAGQVDEVTVRHHHWRQQSRGRLAQTVMSGVGGLLKRPAVSQSSDAPSVVSINEGVTVVIPHYGDPNLALAAARDVRAQVTERPIQTIVVDDASPIPFPENDQSELDVLRLPKNRGFGGAVNAGAREATHPWLLVLNSDVRLEPNFIEDLVSAASSRQPAVCSPALLEVSDRPSSTANLFPGPWSPFASLQPVARWAARGALDRQRGMDTDCVPGVRRQTDWLVGACLLLRSDDFANVQGFDERFHMYAEEVDLQFRLRGQGVPAWFLGDLEVRHVGGGSTGAGGRAAALRRSAVLYAVKRGYSRRLLFAAHATSFANLIYNLVRQGSGRPVRAMDGWRHDRQAWASAWQAGKAASRLPRLDGW